MSKAAEVWPVDTFRVRIGSEIGVSDWFVIDQRRIDSFAAVTQDHQFIHTDPIEPWQARSAGRSLMAI